jgi:hypothetical protein
MGQSGCDPNPCKNSGECVEIGDYGKYFCKCKNGYLKSPTCEGDSISTYKSVYFIETKRINRSTIYLISLLVLNFVLIIIIIGFKLYTPI